MGRKRHTGLDTIAALPWPFGIALGLVGFWVVRYGLGGYFSRTGGALGAGMGTQLADGALAPLAWMLLAVCWIAACVSYLRGRQRARLLQTRSGLDSIAALDWQAFEQLVGEAFQRRGYTVEETGQGGADGGVDLVLRKGGRTTLVQCKRWRQKQVPVTTVREMWGLRAHHAADAVTLVCVGDYTPDARRFAEGKAIDLVTGPELVALVQAVRDSPPPMGALREPIPPAVAATPASPGAAAEPPACPGCSGPMKRRTNRQSGALFWGCAAYPRCRGTRPAA